jgi:hypothetical protein
MSLNADDPLPMGISLMDAYAAIRSWYQANIDRLAADPNRGVYPKAATPYVRAMPARELVTDDEILDTFRRVLAGSLEFGYHASDGSYKMAAYALAASKAAGIDLWT